MESKGAKKSEGPQAKPARYRVVRRFGTARTSREMLKNLLRAHMG